MGGVAGAGQHVWHSGSGIMSKEEKKTTFHRGKKHVVGGRGKRESQHRHDLGKKMRRLSLKKIIFLFRESKVPLRFKPVHPED